MALSNPEISLRDYLLEVQLDKFEQSLNNQGVCSVSDLTEIEKSKLISEVGMTQIQANRVVRTLREMFQDLKLNQEISPALSLIYVPLAQNSNTKEKETSPIMKIRCKLLDRQGISSHIMYRTMLLQPTTYYEFVSHVFKVLKKEKTKINFSSVELYSETGYPLAPSPRIYLQPLSNWNFGEDELIYAYPKKLFNEYLYESDVDCEEFTIGIYLKDSNIKKELKFKKEKILYFDLKIQLALDMHISIDCINIYNFNPANQYEEIVSDNMDIQREFIHKIFLSFTISETYFNSGNGLHSVYRSCFWSTSFLSKFHTLNTDIQELVREYGENRDNDELLRKLGLLRKISCSPPLAHALYLLFTESPTSLPHRIAINEGIITTISIFNISNNPTISTFTQLWRHIESEKKKTRREESHKLLEAVPLNQKTFLKIKEKFPTSDRDFDNQTHNNHKNVSHPPALICPLSKQLFEIPVMTPDGNTYEHKAILQHIKRENTDPLSNTPIISTNLRPNHAIADAIFKYRKKMNLN